MNEKSKVWHDKRSLGFTLIEIIIVFSVLAIVSVTGIAAFLNYSRSQTLNTAVSDVTTMLNVAKSRAISQKIVDSDTGNSWCSSSSFGGYKLVLCRLTDDLGAVTTNPDCKNTNSDDYELQIVCSGASPTNAISSKKLPTKIIFPTSPPSTLSFLFKALKGVVDMGGANPGTIRINGYGSDYKTVNVYQDGRIVAN